MNENQTKTLNREQIKYIAIFFMLLNHIAQIFILPCDFLQKVMSGLGSFTAITMCYFLVEGYEYTRSKKKYAKRLLLFAVLSQIPYSMAFAKEGVIGYRGLNMLFSLFLCFIICAVADSIHNLSLKILCMIGIMACTTQCDWGIGAPVFTLLFIWGRTSVSKKKISFLVPIVLYGIYNFVGRYGKVPFADCLFQALVCMAGMGLSGICIIYFYNGKKSERNSKISKWFFYIFYPLHLLLLAIVRIGLLYQT